MKRRYERGVLERIPGRTGTRTEEGGGVARLLPGILERSAGDWGKDVPKDCGTHKHN